MVPSSTFHDWACFSSAFQPVRSLPLKRAVKPGGGVLAPPPAPAAASDMPNSRPRVAMRLMTDLLRVSETRLHRVGGWGNCRGFADQQQDHRKSEIRNSKSETNAKSQYPMTEAAGFRLRIWD